MQVLLSSLRLAHLLRQPTERAISVMATSMKCVGQLTPIGITLSGDVIFGVTRCLAAKRLGWKEIEARQFPDDVDALRLAIIENAVRQQMTFAENADAIRQYAQVKGITLQQAGKDLNLKQPFVSKCLRADERLTPENKKRLLDAKVGGSLAYLFSQEHDPQRQTALIETALAQKWTRQDIEKHFKQARRGIVRIPFATPSIKLQLEASSEATVEDVLLAFRAFASELSSHTKKGFSFETISRIMRASHANQEPHHPHFASRQTGERQDLVR